MKKHASSSPETNPRKNAEKAYGMIMRGRCDTREYDACFESGRADEVVGHLVSLLQGGPAIPEESRRFVPDRWMDKSAAEQRPVSAKRAWLEGAMWAVEQIDRDHDDSYLDEMERKLLRDMKLANPYRTNPS